MTGRGRGPGVELLRAAAIAAPLADAAQARPARPSQTLQLVLPLRARPRRARAVRDLGLDPRIAAVRALRLAAVALAPVRRLRWRRAGAWCRTCAASARRTSRSTRPACSPTRRMTVAVAAAPVRRRARAVRAAQGGDHGSSRRSRRARRPSRAACRPRSRPRQERCRGSTRRPVANAVGRPALPIRLPEPRRARRPAAARGQLDRRVHAEPVPDRLRLLAAARRGGGRSGRDASR